MPQVRVIGQFGNACTLPERALGSGRAGKHSRLAVPEGDRLPNRLPTRSTIEAGGLPLDVAHRVKLHDIEGAHEPRVVEQLHDLMRLSVVQPAGNRRADARRKGWVDDVEVEADMQVGGRGVDAAQDILHERRMPCSSTARMSWHRTPAAAMASFSSWSIERAPMTETSVGRMAENSRPRRIRARSSFPVRNARLMPCMLPEGEDCGVLKSGWASIQRTATRFPSRAT